MYPGNEGAKSEQREHNIFIKSIIAYIDALIELLFVSNILCIHLYFINCPYSDVWQIAQTTFFAKIRTGIGWKH